MDRTGTCRTVLLSGALLSMVATATPAAGGEVDGERQPVIVVLRDQDPQAVQEQAPLRDRAQRAGGTGVRGFSVINAFSAQLSATEADRLAADPSVAAVVPDRKVRMNTLTEQDRAAVRSAPADPTDRVIPGTCPTDPAQPLLEPEGLQATVTAYAEPRRPQAQRLADGAGVRVAWIADGLDPRNPEFVRADGTPVLADYQDFSGTDPDASGAGGEAFGSASTIASQGRQTYDLSTFVNPAHPLPAGCTVRVRGVAPGAALVGLNVFGSSGFVFSSTILQAIEYAVTVGRVDVIHESFGGPGYFGQNAFPTVGLDPIALANDAAVAAGVTVVTATGQSGSTNTIGSPAVDPRVISVGATTSYRARAQTGTAGARNFATSWASGNASALSSGGVTALGRVPDLVAPGEDGWSACTADAVRYSDCVDFNGNPSTIQYFGGTTLASATVAGAAALVVQAYRRTHGGVRPSPALVKRILTSSATDLGLPAGQQGAGMLNSYRAVQLAMSISDGAGPGEPGGGALLVTAGDGDTQLTATGAPGATQELTLRVTNTAPVPQTVTARGRVPGGTLATITGSVPLDVTSASTPSFPDGTGGAGGPVTHRYATATIAVPAGADQLSGDLAWPGGTANGQSPVGMALIDPTGRYQAFSAPQGPSNHGRVDVRRPVAGTWTAVFHAAAGPTGFHGTVAYELRATRYTAFGEVGPGSQSIAPGRTATFRVRTTLPGAAGDLSAAVELTGSLGVQTSVPLTLRTLVTGSFSGEITGGNGYDNPGAQTQTYAFDVPAGRRDLAIDLTMQGDPNQRVTAALMGPDHQVRSITTNQTLSGTGVPVTLDSLQGYVAKPPAGRWTLFLNVDNPVSGTAVRVPFTGHVRFDVVDVRVSGLPQGTVPAGRPVPVTLTVTNTGVTPARFFADPRLTTQAEYRLLPFAGSKETNPLPLPATEPGPVWLVPTQTSTLTVQQSSTVPADFDLAPVNGGIPEYYGAPQGAGLTAVASVTGERINQGLWNGVSSPLGPTNGPVSGTTTLTATVRTRAFDPAAASTTGNAWLLGVQGPQPFTPLLLQPGQTGAITVTMTPTGTAGTTVSGALYVDTFAVSTFLLGGSAVEEAAEIPYEYTIGG